jgi:hypothetical protein
LSNPTFHEIAFYTHGCHLPGTRDYLAHPQWNPMKPKYCAVFNHSDLHGGMQVGGLTESQLIKTLLNQGVHTLSSIMHEDQSPGKIRPVEGKEMISIWKQVYKVIQKRKQDCRRTYV